MLLSPSDISIPEIHEPDPELDPDSFDPPEEPYLDNVWSEIDGELDSIDAGSEVS